jgi:SAM-dependent methyltransferase
MTFAGAGYWNSYFRDLRETGDDLDWGGRWISPFLDPLREVRAHTVLELGCGTGNDAARLAGEGYTVTALDISSEAIAAARSRHGSVASFRVADMSKRLPFDDGRFDAVMSNVALHMFPDAVTRAIFAEIGRVVRPDGLLLFHVNALEDRPLRARALPVVQEPEANFVVEQTGQTMHFFSDKYLQELLREWRRLDLELLEIAHRKTGLPFKWVWRGVARR